MCHSICCDELQKMQLVVDLLERWMNRDFVALRSYIFLFLYEKVRYFWILTRSTGLLQQQGDEAMFFFLSFKYVVSFADGGFEAAFLNWTVGCFCR